MGTPLIHGELRDYVTGEMIPDTDDERLRQAIAHRLLDELGYRREHLEVRLRHEVTSAPYRAAYLIDFAVTLVDRLMLLVRFCPGALVARERTTTALARHLGPYTVPRAVITNGRDARLLDGESGQVLATGLGAIPDCQQLTHLAKAHRFAALDERRRQAEARILVAFDALESECDRLPCGAEPT